MRQILIQTALTAILAFSFTAVAALVTIDQARAYNAIYGGVK